MTTFAERTQLHGQAYVEKITFKLRACQYAIDPVDKLHGGLYDGTCFGFSSTCSTSDAYADDAFIYLSFVNQPVPTNATDCILAGLRKVAMIDPVLDPAESMGTRARLSFSIDDMNHGDIGLVPYVDRRSKSGTLFGKLLARHPYFEGVEVIYSRGLRPAGTFVEPDWVDYSFFIDKLTLKNNICDVTCYDALTFTDEKKSQIPAPSSGQLSADISTGATSFTIVNAADYYYGAFGETAYIRIDGETKEVEVTGALTFDVITAGYKSEEKDHKSGATVNLCYRKTNIHLVDFIVDVLTNYTTTPASYIDDYSALVAATPELEVDEILITKPEDAKKYINQAIQMGILNFHASPKLQKIVIEKLDELDTAAYQLELGVNIARDSVVPTRNESGQITNFTHRWGLVDVTKTGSDNYYINHSPYNIDVISTKGRGGLNVGKDLNNLILTDSTSDSLIGATYSSRKLDRFRSVPWDIEFMVDSKFIGDDMVKLGGLVSIPIRERQNKDGTIAQSVFQVTSIQGNDLTGFTCKGPLYQTAIIDSGDVDFTISGIYEDYDLSAHFAPAAGSYTVYIAAGSVFGATSTSVFAFTTGAQAAGVSFHFINRGSGFGAGGDGGDAGINAGAGASAGQNGGGGGDCFEVTVPCTFDNGEGQIFGGGGGAAGGCSFSISNSEYPDGLCWLADAGSGGQGYAGGTGGAEATASNPLCVIARESTAGDDGSSGAAGTTGYDGGGYGEDGEDVTIAADGSGIDEILHRYGGSAGYAVRVTGSGSATFITGSSELNLKGLVGA